MAPWSRFYKDLEIQSTGGGGGNFQLHVALVDAPDYKVEKTIPIS